VMAARHRSIPVVLDGFVVGASVLPLHLLERSALEHCVAGHCSAEVGHRRLLELIGKEPLLDLGMRLGEGSGALAAVPLLALACVGVTDVATFAEWFGWPGGGWLHRGRAVPHQDPTADCRRRRPPSCGCVVSRGRGAGRDGRRRGVCRDA